jgi:hypothetical protein
MTTIESSSSNHSDANTISGSESTESSTDSNCQSFVWQEEDYFCKVSKNVDFVAENESQIGKILTALNHPNIVKFIKSERRTFSILNGELIHYDQHQDPCETLKALVTIWEKLDNVSLSDIIEDENVCDQAVASCVCQTILCIFELQNLFGFVHGDLHTSNVLVQRTREEFMYYFDKTIKIPTFGYVAKIIDFGNSCLWKHNPPKHMFVPFYAYTDGVVNMWFDSFYDLRIFFEGVAYDLFNARKTKFVGDFQRMTSNLLCCFKHTYGKVEPTKDVYCYLVAFLQSCFKMHQQQFACDAAFIADMFGALITFPLDENRIEETATTAFSPLEIEKVNRFLESWLEFEKFLTIEQAKIFFKKIVEFVRAYEKDETLDVEEIESKFNNFINEEMSNCGQTMVAFNFNQTSILFHSFVIACNSVFNILINDILKYQRKIVQSTDETISLMSSLTNQQPFFMSVITLLSCWFDNI